MILNLTHNARLNDINNRLKKRLNKNFSVVQEVI